MPRQTSPHNVGADDALIGQALECATASPTPPPPPRTLKGQINYVLRKLGTARAVGSEIGITADSVNRYRRGARQYPPSHIPSRIDEAVHSRWQPRVRERVRRRAAQQATMTV
ncbi:hypothetical protein GT030_30980 [Streptomyces sp. SID1328]|uniref:hypothetical protein n=1 Tax=Streptomyces sp. SID1328 TaxID=2690250 RepID=UPI00136D09C5|nr:hypothetical protein [Streptomyces sp. SID1328]MYV43159.1 hypothetical protein [Streptomyces sp. SID1328]